MPTLELSNAECNYVVSCFEAALAPAPKEPPKDDDSKNYTGANVRLCNEVLLPFDCAIVHYRGRMEEATKRIGKLSSDSIRPDLSPEVLQAMSVKFGAMLGAELEELAQTDGKAIENVVLNDTLFKWFKEEWPSVNRPSNYKQRAIAALINAAIDAASTKKE